MLQNYWRILTKCFLDTGSTLVLYDPFETDNTPLCDYRLEFVTCVHNEASDSKSGGQAFNSC